MTKEIFKTLDFNPRYAVSNLGNVKNLDTEKLVVPSNKGYLNVRLYDLNKKKGEPGYRKDYQIHRLVALNFVKNPDNKPFVNHIDGNKFNNDASNLEWCTASENMIHAYKNNLVGVKKPIKAINLSDETDVKVFESIAACARFFNCNKAFIYRALVHQYNRQSYQGFKFEYV